MCTVIFNTIDKEEWLGEIMQVVYNIPSYKKQSHEITIGVSSEGVLTSFHIASLACLIEYADKCGLHVKIRNNTNAEAYLNDVIQLGEYWATGSDYIEAKDETVSNLWRITNSGKEVHGRRIQEYLERKFLQNKELDAVHNGLTEAYYNVFDHAHANGIAFSAITFNKESQVLDATICDFGVGMIQPIKESFPQITSDEEAIRKSIEAKFTIGSSLHNGGMGLDNIRSSCTENDKLSIFSNMVCLEADSEDVSVHKLDFDFKGTLINFGITLSHLPDKDYIEDFIF